MKNSIKEKRKRGTWMANYAKYTRGAIGHVTRHYERAKDEYGNYIKFGNQEIDVSRSHLNYNLAPEQVQLQAIHKRLDEVYCMNRKDVNVMCSWVITAPKDLHEERQSEFFKTTYEFLEKKYGQKNIISSYVHLDENTPYKVSSTYVQKILYNNVQLFLLHIIFYSVRITCY